MTFDSLRVAAVQLCATDNPGVNVIRAEMRVGEAARAGAMFVVLPEKWNAVVPDGSAQDAAEPLDGPSIRAAQAWAHDHGIAILAGSILEEAPDGAVFNTSVLIDPGGEITAVYRKMHLFDVAVGGHVYRESAATRPGDAPVGGEVWGRPIGMSVCYDLRFPELYRYLSARGADILTVPAAFTATTGAGHWEPLLRARAIENQAFVIGAGQFGTHATGMASYGHSMIVDPWGTVLAEGTGDREEVILADLDFARLASVRESLPALSHRRDLPPVTYPSSRTGAPPVP
jgi:predicted amidohydrolase